MWARIENDIIAEYPVYSLHSRLNHISLPVDITDDTRLPVGWVYINPTTPPDAKFGYNYVEDIPKRGPDNRWYLGWKQEPWSTEQISSHHNSAWQSIVNTVYHKLDQLAVDYGYRNTIDVCSYVNSTVPKFVTEARQFIKLRDRIRTSLLEVKSKIDTGVIDCPNDFKDIEKYIPKFELAM